MLRRRAVWHEVSSQVNRLIAEAKRPRPAPGPLCFDRDARPRQRVRNRKCHSVSTSAWTMAEAKIDPVLRHVHP